MWEYRAINTLLLALQMPQESINLRGIPLAWYIFFCQKIYTKERSRYTMKFLKIVEEIQNKIEEKILKIKNL